MNVKSMATVAALAVFPVLATPEVKNVTIDQEDGTRLVTVTYELTEEAIVTVDFLTNATENVWTSIGYGNIDNVSGDVWKVVPAGKGHSILWAPHKSWPNNFADMRAKVTAHALDNPPDYLVFDLRVADTVRYYPCEAALPGGRTNDIYRTELLAMRRIPAANIEWCMGSPETEENRKPEWEYPHMVTLTNDYYMGIYPVTEWQYFRMTGIAAAADTRTCPVNNIIYANLRGTAWPAGGYETVDAGSVIASLRSHTGLRLDLPTEAQWEYACRAGTGSAIYNGNESGYGDVGWHAGNSGKVRKIVGTKPGNAWGLYDMSGNIYEWCLDYFTADLRTLPSTAPVGPDTGTARILRGGSYNDAAERLRSAWRNNAGQSSGANVGRGFRLALVIP